MKNSFIKKALLIGSEGFWTFLVSVTLLLGSATLSLWPVLTYVIVLAKRENRPQNSQTLLVLGERLQNNSPGINYIARLQRANKIYNTEKIKQIFIVGGITGEASISESACGKNFLVNQNIPESVITIEDKSRHTLENLRNVRDMLPADSTDKICIITSRFHLARTAVLASGLGIDNNVCAAEDKFKNSLMQWILIIREAFFIHWYYTAKYWAILINNKATLRRIR